MMEELQTIFAVGAGAVTKLVKRNKLFESQAKIKRLFHPKYPYEYLREFESDQEEQNNIKKEKLRKEVRDFFNED